MCVRVCDLGWRSDDNATSSATSPRWRVCLGYQELPVDATRVAPVDLLADNPEPVDYRPGSTQGNHESHFSGSLVEVVGDAVAIVVIVFHLSLFWL